MMENFGDYELKSISSPQEMQAVEDLQALVWQGARTVPAHLMIAIAHNPPPRKNLQSSIIHLLWVQSQLKRPHQHLPC